MKRQTQAWRLWSALLAAAGIIAGCQSTQKVDDAARARAEQREVFREHLVLATEAINLGDLDGATGHLDEARSAAFDDEQSMKVDSLATLIAGAEALMDGDVDSAQTRWASIQDTTLSAEVRDKAQDIGMDVPPIDTESEVQE
jgi:hypothetical protein